MPSPFPILPTLGYGTSGPVAPASSWQARASVLTAKFGGRYTQRVGDGVNALLRDFSYQTKLMIPAEIKILDDFLILRKGYLPFRFMIPGETVYRQFICDNWSARYESLHATLTGVFMENFDA